MTSPAVDSLWLHRSGKGPYYVVAVTEAHNNRPAEVIYRGVSNGKWWTRKLSEWDTKMSPLLGRHHRGGPSKHPIATLP